MAAWSNDEETVMNTHWTYSESANSNEEVQMFGLRSVVAGNLDNDDTSGRVSYDDCDNLDYCVNCRSAGETALATCLLAFFCLMPLFLSTALRVKRTMDNKIMKLGSIFLTGSVLFWTVVAVWNWNGTCVEHLPIVGGTTGYKNGPGYNCVVCILFWMFFSLFVHVTIPVNGSTEGTNQEPLTDQQSQAAQGGGQSYSEEETGPGSDFYVAPPDGSEKKNQV